MRALTHDLTKCFDALEHDQVGEVGHDIGEGTSVAPLEPRRRKCIRMEEPNDLDDGEGTSYGLDQYEEPSTGAQATAEVAGSAVDIRGEYNATHNTSGRPASWPWFGGRQQQEVAPNISNSPPWMWPGVFWPPVNPQWFGWGMPFTSPIEPRSNLEGKNFGTPQHPSVPNTGYNSAPFAAIPYTDYSTPLGDHLTPAIKERIWKGNYIDVYELLNREYEVKELDKDDDKIKEKHRRKRPDRNWTNWVTGFTIYAGVLVKMQPWKASALFQYFDILRRAKAEFEGQVWLRYDEAFRMRSAIRPELRWDEVHPGIWLQHMSPAKTNLGDRFDCGHLNIKFAGNSGTRQGAGQAVQPRLPCYEFNNKGSCAKSPGRFRHECLTCRGEHPKTNCFRAGGQRQSKAGGPNKKVEGGSGAPGKGANTN